MTYTHIYMYADYINGNFGLCIKTNNYIEKAHIYMYIRCLFMEIDNHIWQTFTDPYTKHAATNHKFIDISDISVDLTAPFVEETVWGWLDNIP